MRRRLNRRSSFEDDMPNAMSGVSNLADVMLVLAVGIMLALVINWHISVGGGTITQVESGQMHEIDAAEYGSNLENADEADSDPNLERKGTVYIDRSTGKMYLIESDE